MQAGTFFAQPPEEVGIPGWEGVPLLDFAQKAEEASESEVSGRGSPKSLGPPTALRQMAPQGSLGPYEPSRGELVVCTPVDEPNDPATVRSCAPGPPLCEAGPISVEVFNFKANSSESREPVDPQGATPRRHGTQRQIAWWDNVVELCPTLYPGGMRKEPLPFTQVLPLMWQCGAVDAAKEVPGGPEGGRLHDGRFEGELMGRVGQPDAEVQPQAGFEGCNAAQRGQCVGSLQQCGAASAEGWGEAQPQQQSEAFTVGSQGGHVAQLVHSGAHPIGLQARDAAQPLQHNAAYMASHVGASWNGGAPPQISAVAPMSRQGSKWQTLAPEWLEIDAAEFGQESGEDSPAPARLEAPRTLVLKNRNGPGASVGYMGKNPERNEAPFLGNRAPRVRKVRSPDSETSQPGRACQKLFHEGGEALRTPLKHPRYL